jgi:hypothetical protein
MNNGTTWVKPKHHSLKTKQPSTKTREKTNKWTQTETALTMAVVFLEENGYSLYHWRQHQNTQTHTNCFHETHSGGGGLTICRQKTNLHKTVEQHAKKMSIGRDKRHKISLCSLPENAPTEHVTTVIPILLVPMAALQLLLRGQPPPLTPS